MSSDRMNIISGGVMDDPLVAENKVPAYEIVEEKIREIDSTIIIVRTYFLSDNFSYRFQLIKKDRMCIVEIPKRLLDNLKSDGSTSEKELTDILKLYMENADCWIGFEG